MAYISLGMLSTPQSLKLTEIDTSNIVFKLGSECPQCNKIISYSTSISICECKRYGHSKCIKNQFETMKLNLTGLFICKQCRLKLPIRFEQKLMINLLKIFNKEMLLIIFFFLFLLLIVSVHMIFNVFAYQPNQRNLVKLIIIILLAVFLLFLEFFIIFSRLIFVRNIITDIPNSKNELVTSAFKDMAEPEEQTASDCIFT